MLEFLFDRLKPEDLTVERMATLDASLIIDGYLTAVGLPREDYLKRYVRAAEDTGTLDSVFPDGLIEAIRQSTPGEPQTGG